MTLLATYLMAACFLSQAPTVENANASSTTIFIKAVLADAIQAVDGDTIIVHSRELIAYSAPIPGEGPARVNRQEFTETLTVRLIGVDTPEVNEDGAKKATKFTQKWLKKNKRLMLMIGEPNIGLFGRVLAVVLPEPVVDTVPFVDSLNCRLLGEGLGEPVTHFENTVLALVEPCMEPLEIE